MMDLYETAKLCYGYALITLGTAITVYAIYKMWVERE